MAQDKSSETTIQLQLTIDLFFSAIYLENDKKQYHRIVPA
jgi:hypothetical protein